LSKAGQTVQAASLLNNRTPQGLQYAGIRTLKKAGVEITPEIQQRMIDLTSNIRKQAKGSYEEGLARFELMDYVNKQVPSSKTSKAIQIWKAGLLTSPRTTAGNITSGVAELILRKGYVDPLANALDAAFSVFTGKRSRSMTVRGIGGGLGEGSEKAVQYFKTGYDPRDPLSKFDIRQIHYSDTPLGKAAEVYTQGVFRLMGAADQPFYYAALRNSLYDQALTAAKNQGLKGKTRSDFVKKFISEPEAATMQLADAEARYAVFQNQTALGTAASRLKNMEGLPGDVVEFIAPFTGVPSSIATRMVERTPIGTAIEIAKQIKNRQFDQRAMTQAISNGTMVIPLAGAGAALYNEGLLTLAFPTDQKERELWELEGKQPYSIKIGDNWYSMNYLAPTGNLLAVGGEYAAQRKDGATPQEAFNTTLAGGAKSLTEMSFLQGVSGAIGAINDPARAGQKFAESTAGSVVPNVIRTAARAGDPVQREIDTMGDAFLAGIPGARQTLDEKKNILGEAIPRRSNPLAETVNPLRPSAVLNQDNPIVQELRRLQDAKEGIVPSKATKASIEGLDDAKLREINNRVATEVTGEWQRILDDPRYATLNDGDKKRILERANDAVYGAVKSDYKEGASLTKLQELYKRGNEIDYFSGFEQSKDKNQLGGFVLFGTDRRMTGQDYDKLLSIDINNIEVAEHYISTFDACIGAIYFDGKHKIFAVDFEKVIGYFDIITDNYDYYLRVDDQGDTLRVEKVFEDDYTALRSKKTKRGKK
jgi:hypothetical protein